MRINEPIVLCLLEFGYHVQPISIVRTFRAQAFGLGLKLQRIVTDFYPGILPEIPRRCRLTTVRYCDNAALNAIATQITPPLKCFRSLVRISNL